jgi:mitochondrial fission protein ELM1
VALVDDSSPIIRAKLSFRPAPVAEPAEPVADAAAVRLQALGFASEPLTIWAVSDGRPAVDDQVMGLAEAIARLTPAEITRKVVRWKSSAYGRRPTILKMNPRGNLAADVEPFEPPWPDLCIAAGRASLPFSLGIRKWSKRETFVVQVQDPRWPSHMFDAVVAPRHDRVWGSNVIEVTGALHRATPQALQYAYDDAFEELESLPRPRAAVLIGGGGRKFDVSTDRAAKLAAEIALALESDGGSVMLAFSPTTPEPARDVLISRLSKLPSIIWDGRFPDPTLGFLAAADYILVTEDLVKGACEAATTGAPVFVLKIDGVDLGHNRFHDEMEKLDVARPFGGQLYDWAYEPLNETDRAAVRILRRLRDVADTAEVD